MSKPRRTWVVWKCLKCQRKHKYSICGHYDYKWCYGWNWKCEKCGKINIFTIKMSISEDYDRNKGF